MLLIDAKVLRTKTPYSFYVFLKNTLKYLDIDRILLTSYKDFHKLKEVKEVVLWFPCSIPSLKLLSVLKKKNIFIKKIVLTIHGTAPFLLNLGHYRYNLQDITLFSLKHKLTYNIANLKLLLKWYYFSLLSNSYIVTVSKSEKKILKSLLIKNKITYIYHGVDHNIFRPLNIEKDKVFIHVSNFLLQKNIFRIIRAFIRLKKEIKDSYLKLLIIGKYPTSIINMVKRKDIIFLGSISEKDLVIYYNKALALVNPSIHESFGLPILEAMASGCPVITSNVYAPKEIVGDAGILVNPFSIEEIKEAMKRLYLDEDYREILVKKGIKRAKRFSWKNTAKKYKKLFLK